MKRILSMLLVAAMLVSMLPVYLPEVKAATVSDEINAFMKPLSSPLKAVVAGEFMQPLDQEMPYAATGQFILPTAAAQPALGSDGFVVPLSNPLPQVDSSGLIRKPQQPLPELPVDGGFLAPIGAPDPEATVITTAEQLAAIKSGSYVLGADIDLKDYKGGNWTPLTLKDALTLDGQGYRILNLNVPLTSNAGLIGETDDRGTTTIRNLGVENTVEGLAVSGTKHAGALVAFAQNSLVLENCYSTVEVSCINENMNDYTAAGGLVGIVYDYGELQQCTLINCYNTGNVTASDFWGIGYAAVKLSGAGGLLGCLVGSYKTGEISLQLIGCLNNGVVFGGSSSGGLMGFCQLKKQNAIVTVTGCCNNGTITGGSTAGLIGSLRNEFVSYTVSPFLVRFSDCINRGALCATLEESSDYFSGGMLGYMCTEDYDYSEQIVNSSVTVSNCSNTAQITSVFHAGGLLGKIDATAEIFDSFNSGDLDAMNSMGGLVAEIISFREWDSEEVLNDLEVTRCFNTGNLTSIAHTFEDYDTGEPVSLYYLTYAGGLVGCGSGTLAYSYNTGSIIGGICDPSGGELYVGGLVGIGSFDMSACRNTGDIVLTEYASDYVNDFQGEVGGLVGSGAGKMNNCSNLGKVIIEPGEFGTVIAGGLIGNTDGNGNYGGILGLINCCNTGEVFGTGSAGGLVATSDYAFSLLSNCFNTGKVTSLYYTAAGIVNLHLFKAVVENCYNTGDISALASASGLIINTFTSEAQVSMTDCCNTGNVISDTSTVSGLYESYGMNEGTVKNCFNTGNLTGKAVCGLGSGNFSNCYNAGTIAADSVGYGLGVGSFCFSYNTGDVSGETSCGLGETSSAVTYCWNTGNITGIKQAFGLAGGPESYSRNFLCCYNSGNIRANGDYAAGVGKGSAENCFNLGSVTNTTANATTYPFAAGLVVGATSLRYCYNTGSVTMTSRTSRDHPFHLGGAGGLMGFYHDKMVEVIDCANLGNVDSASLAAGLVCSWDENVNIARSYNTGDISTSGCYGVGGLTFFGVQIVDSCNLGNVSSVNITNGFNATGGLMAMSCPRYEIGVENCYNTGRISAIGELQFEVVAGGLVGCVYDEGRYDNLPISNSYNAGNVRSENKFIDSSTFVRTDPNESNCKEREYLTESQLANSTPCIHSGYACSGGLAGYGDLTIFNSKNLGQYQSVFVPGSSHGDIWGSSSAFSAHGNVTYGISNLMSHIVLSIQNKVDPGYSCRVVKPGDTLRLSVYFSAPAAIPHTNVRFTSNNEAVTISSVSYSETNTTSGYFTVELAVNSAIKENTEVSFTASIENNSENLNDICRILVDTSQDYSFYLYERDSEDKEKFVPISQAAVTINNMTRMTDEEGYAYFSKEDLNLSSNIVSLEAYKEGYVTVEAPYYTIADTTVNRIFMEPREKDKIYITSAVVMADGLAEDILSREQTFNLVKEAQQTCMTYINVDWNNMEKGNIYLTSTHGELIQLSQSGSGSVAYYRMFQEKAPIEIYAYTFNEENKLCEILVETKLRVIPMAPDVQPPSSDTMTGDEGVPMLSGLSIGVQWDKLLEKSDYKNSQNVKVQNSDGVVTVSYEKSTRDGTDIPQNTPAKLLESASSMPRLEVTTSGKLNIPLDPSKSAGGSFDVSMMVLPKKEFEQKYKMNKSDGTFDVAWEWDMPAWGTLPLYGKLGLGAKATTSGEITIPAQAHLDQVLKGFVTQKYFSTTTSLTGKMEVEGGIGKNFESVNTGVTGGLKFEAVPTLSFVYFGGDETNVTFEPKFEGTGSLVFEIEVFGVGVEGQKDIRGFIWDQEGFSWVDHTGKRLQEEATTFSLRSASDIDAWGQMTLIGGEYLEQGGGFRTNGISLFSSAANGPSVVFENIFSNASADLTAINDQRVLYFTTDAAADGGRTRANALMLVQTNLDAAERTMVPIEDDGTLDSHFAADGNVVVWEDANKVFSDNLTLNELMASKEITAAVEKNGQWQVQSLTSNNYLDFAPSVAKAADGTALVAWLSNSDNDYLAQTGVTNLHYAFYDGTEWSAVKTVDNVGSVVTVDALYDGSAAMVVYKSDLAEQNLTIDTTTLAYSINATGQEMYRYCTGLYKDQKQLAWFDADEILHLPDGSKIETSYNAFSNPVMTVNNNVISVFWTEFDGIYCTTNAAGSFSEKIHLCDTTGMIWHLDALTNASGGYELSWLETKTLTKEDGDTYNQTDLVAMTVQPGVDLVLEGVVVQEQTYMSNGLVSGTVGIRNNGTVTATGLELSGWFENNCLMSDSHDISIKPGETAELDFSFVARDPGTKATYSLQIQTSNVEDLVPEDNIGSTTIGTADAEMLSCVTIPQNDGTSTLRLRASNNGSTVLRDVMVTLYDENMENPVTLIDGQTMYAGKQSLWEIPTPALAADTVYRVVISADGDEKAYNDQIMFVTTAERPATDLSIQSLTHDDQENVMTVVLDSVQETAASGYVFLAVQNGDHRMEQVQQELLQLPAGEGLTTVEIPLDTLPAGTYTCKIMVTNLEFVPLCEDKSCLLTTPQPKQHSS